MVAWLCVLALCLQPLGLADAQPPTPDIPGPILCMWVTNLPLATLVGAGAGMLKGSFIANLGCAPGILGNDCNWSVAERLLWAGPPQGWVPDLGGQLATCTNVPLACGTLGTPTTISDTYGPLANGLYTFYAYLYTGSDCEAGGNYGTYTAEVTL